MTLANAKSVNRQNLENVLRNAASEFTRRTAIASLASLSSESATHFRAFPASIRELPPKMRFFSWQKRDCQIVLVLPSHMYIIWSRRYAERIWGEFFILVRRILGKLPANFSANFDGEFGWRIFRPCFSKVSGRQKKKSRPKFTSRIVGIPLQFHFLEPKIYSRRLSACGGDQHNTVSESMVSDTELNEVFVPHQVPVTELSEFLSASYLRAKAKSPSFFCRTHRVRRRTQ